MTEDTPDPMSKPQRESLQKAWDILTEHFDHVLLVIDFECPDEEGGTANAHEGYWHGGSMAAIGLAEFAKARLMRSGKTFNDPEEP